MDLSQIGLVNAAWTISEAERGARPSSCFLAGSTTGLVNRRGLRYGLESRRLRVRVLRFNPRLEHTRYEL
jgi:hypothetical protein